MVLEGKVRPCQVTLSTFPWEVKDLVVVLVGQILRYHAAVQNFFGLTSSRDCWQDWATPRKLLNPECGCRAQLLYGMGTLHQGEGQGKGRGLMYVFQRYLLPGESGTERH